MFGEAAHTRRYERDNGPYAVLDNRLEGAADHGRRSRYELRSGRPGHNTSPGIGRPVGHGVAGRVPVPCRGDSGAAAGWRWKLGGAVSGSLKSPGSARTGGFKMRRTHFIAAAAIVVGAVAITGAPSTSRSRHRSTSSMKTNSSVPVDCRTEPATQRAKPSIRFPDRRGTGVCMVVPATGSRSPTTGMAISSCGPMVSGVPASN